MELDVNLGNLGILGKPVIAAALSMFEYIESIPSLESLRGGNAII